MKMPKIEKGKVVVYRADTSTGHILNNDRSIYLNEGDNFYRVFDNIEEAKRYVEECLNKGDSVEFLIEDHDGISLEHIIPAVKKIPLPKKEDNFFIRLWKKIWY